MKIECNDQLICVPLTIKYSEKKKTIERMIIDTGAAHSLISSDVEMKSVFSLKMVTK